MLLAIDLGTTAVKASLTDLELRMVRTAQKPIDTRRDSHGRAEQNAADWLSAVRELTAQVCAGDAAVEGIAVTGHMLGCLPLDVRGQPLAPAMIHQDSRSAVQVAELERIYGATALYRLFGNRPGPSSLGKLLWLRQMHPELFARARWFVQAKDYLTGWLCGDYGWTDWSDATHGCLAAIDGSGSATALLGDLGLPLDRLPAIRAGISKAGNLTGAAAQTLGLTPGIPVAAGCGDGAAATLGAGATRPGDHYGCLGTTAWIAVVSDHPVLDEAMRSFCLIGADGRSVATYGTAQNAGTCVDWAALAWDAADAREIDRIASKAPPGSGGLIFLPYLTGERTPWYDSEARGLFVGIGPEHDRAHMLRAVLEGVAFALRDIIAVHRANNLRIDDLPWIGGGAASDIWRQIISDVIGIPTTITSQPRQTTTIGAAILAGCAAGVFADPADAAVRVARTRPLEPSPEAAAVYDPLYAVYQNLYPALKPAFSALARYRTTI